ncbi:alpha-D-ribose 1-methylphosphonate 5-triphosphate diphosphatase [Pseudoruegeria sp. HB172150]|uniref:alpha-D-ribose 1-methylphosphonate 5-triphosphate diphosphatase n=1 Tax=Pseudoruegeria sp. HB172150 TaxID=2721164 RepID=UPI0020A66CEF|nr:alpha-D-ribose 1-methylphosphonate 5-triphosphate diphosphatase [Pseudoruegeria sp. HB172150]
MDGTGMMQATVFEGAEVVLGDRIEKVSVRVEDGVITGLDVSHDGARVVEAKGRLLAPALVDVHGDAFERQLMPRPGVFFPIDVAVLETDRQLAGNGIATAYHAMTMGWEPGLRSIDRGRELVQKLSDMAPRLAVENRVQLRWETFCLEAEDALADMLASGLTPSVAFNDHTSMGLLAPDVRLQDRPFELSPDFPVVDTTSAEFRRKMEKRAMRSDIPVDAFISLMLGVWERRPQVADGIARVAEKARAVGAPMLSHDDTQIETRDFYRGHGSRISEFPMNDTVTEAAREAGDWIVFGSPNVVRGGSHIGSPSAAEMVERGLCDILASDYYYPAVLAAVARLHAEERAPLHELWKLISTNAAAASGLTDRGEIATGKRADLVLVDWPDSAAPKIDMTLSAGRVAHSAF